MPLSRRNFIQGIGAGTLFTSQVAHGQAPEKESGLAAAGEKTLSTKPSDDNIRRGFGLHLFVDQEDVERSEGITFTYHSAEKHAANPMIVADTPWERGTEVKPKRRGENFLDLWGGGVLYDDQEQLFKIWYGCRCGLAYATSSDGLNWEKPALGFHGVGKPPAGPESNVFRDFVEIFGIHCNRFEADPARRYKTLAGYGKALVSPDGLRWSPIGRVFGGRSEVNPTTADPGRNRYLAFPKVLPECYDGSRRRSVAVTTSPDFVNWDSLQTVLIPDRLDDERAARLKEERYRLLAYPDVDVNRGHFYGMFGHPYGNHHYVGLALMFYATGYQHHPGWEEHRKNKKPGGDTGLGEIQIAFSRDLKRWNRPPDRQPVIGLGNPLSWEGGWLVAPAMVVHKDEIRIYYAGGIWSHSDPVQYGDAKDENWSTLASKLKGPGWGIGMATLRLDGFASADAGQQEGSMLTKPMELEGVSVTINAKAPNGQVRAELLDEHGRALPGFSLADCQLFTGDSLRRRLSWNGRDSLGQLLGRKIRLRFHLRNASLYSYTIGG